MEIVRSFKKVERSYHSTPNGWRLATFEEAKNGLERNIVQQHLKEWERARLLDGWISGSGYGYEIKNEFRGCMGYMLLIQTRTSAHDESGTPYADVNLSELGKEVALFLCVDDWNLEVVYWLLNTWSKSHSMMELSDVSGGNIAFTSATKFKKMNVFIGRLARRLGDEEVAARHKGRRTKYSGTDSVKEVLSGMMQIVTGEEQVTGYEMRGFYAYGGDKYLLPDSLRTRDFAEVFWSFACETFAAHVVEISAFASLQKMLSMKTKRDSEKNLKIATFILLYLSDYRSDIIHEPLPHSCWGNCAAEFLSNVEEKAGGDPDRFSEMLKHNAMWRCYDDTGNYGVLNKLLFSVATGRHNRFGRENFTAAIVDMLLKCGAQPAGCYAIHDFRERTTLHIITEFQHKDVSREVAKLLLDSCGEESRARIVNAVNENRMTALHIASELGNASLCELLIEFNASVNVQDNKGMTPLHYAVYEGTDEVINFFIKCPQVGKSVGLKDKRGNTPIDIAVAKKYYALTAKLLTEWREAEPYLSKMDQEQLLRYSLLFGSVDIVEKLYEKGIKLPAGDCDEDGRSALHLAAMQDDAKTAKDIIDIILLRIRPELTPEQIVNMVSKRDRIGRTVLHEAALKGHEEVCKILLDINPKLLYVKDRDRRNPLYDLAKGKYKGADLTIQWLNAWEKKDMHDMEDLIDRSGLTPLHVAASQGNFNIVLGLLSNHRFSSKYLSRGDFLGQTALHKAAESGDIVTVEILLEHRAHPLKERDCDGRTALHYAVQAESGDKMKLADALFRRCQSKEEKSLLLWASAAGLGTADKYLSKNDPLHEFLLCERKEATEKNNLLRMAASVGDFEMTKELIARGYQTGEIIDAHWKEGLDEKKKENVTRVSKLIERVKDQGNDRPAILDTLGRVDYAQGIAALFLNPYIKPPIAVGITGTWGMGKSTLMLQTEQILLATAAQMALLESSKLPGSALELPDIKSYKLSRKGKRKCENIYKQIMYGESINRNLNRKRIQELEKFLNNYDTKYRKVFKSLAAMDSSDMFEPNVDPSAEENVPAVLTVQYNAWKYRNDTEALAGMAVEITKELEGLMTHAQWLSTCCRNTWRKKKHTLWIEIFFPSLLALVLVSSLTWIIWVVFDNDKLKKWVKTKYAWPPAAMVIIVWTLTKSVMGILKPVSTQLMQYISFPDHSEKLGYQERVISDITFLKEEIGKRAYCAFLVFGWVFTTFRVLWRLVAESWLWATSLFFHHRSFEKAIDALKITPASGSNLRIIVFVDDLDRCQESVILQVLSAINIVLAECKINVVMGMDKKLIQRAIMKKYGDGKAKKSLKTSQELADLYLQKIIQLPLDLPDPSDEESSRFLKAQLGVYEHKEEAAESNHLESSADEESDDVGSSSSDVEGEGEEQNTPAHFRIPMPESNGDGEMNVPSAWKKKCLKLFVSPVRNIAHSLQALRKEKPEMGVRQNSSPSILIREMLFVRYSNGEETAFLFFQGLATDSRKLPREWKRLLNYHRLVWYIFSVSKEAKILAGWQVQLITWIFVCWEWQENMNLVIEKWKEIKWKEITDPETSESNGPSLLMIVEHFIEQHERGNQKMTATGKEEDGFKRAEIFREAGGIVSENKDNGEPESSNTQQEKMNERLVSTDDQGSIARSTDDAETMEKDTPQKLLKEIDKLDALQKSFAELKKEMKKIKEQASDELKGEMKELRKQVSDELKKEIEELKAFSVSHDIREQMVEKQNGKKEQKMENEKNKLYNLEDWRRMKSTLEKYDVSMDGIQAFQRFRFYCIAGYLPRPSFREQ